MTGGVIEGGWEYVAAAYAVTAIILVAYAASVLARYRAELGRRARVLRETAEEGPS
jgi:hypothetical protein